MVGVVITHQTLELALGHLGGGDFEVARQGDLVAGLFAAGVDRAKITAGLVGRGAHEEAPRREPYGKVAVWRDPFGNRWDLLQFT